MNATPQILGGRYEVGELIGRGGMAEVHLGLDSRLGRPVAIKMLRSDLARDHSFLTRFRREAQSAAGLNHASIVSVYDSGEDHSIQAGGAQVDVPYIIMEYVEGRTLREILTEREQLDPGEASRITEGILDALAYSHRMGIVHRDIKPANVMISSTGQVKVMDFGIARAVADTSATMTQTQAVIGTAQYLSPEQAQGQQVDARSDIYSTGCLLFELLTGRTPFVGDSPVAIAYQHVGEAPPRASAYNPSVSDELDAVVLHALAKDREQRYQTADDFRQDLISARMGHGISHEARGAAFAAGAAGLGGAATTMLNPYPGSGEPTAAYGQAGYGAAGAAGAGYDPYATAGYGAASRTGEYGNGYGSAGPGGGPYATDPRGNTAGLPAVGHDPKDEPEKRRGLAYVLLTLAVVGVVALLAWLGANYLGNQDVGQRQVQVPSVVKQELSLARAAVTKAGFTVEVEEVASDEEPGIVVEQSPGGGEMAAMGSTVVLSVSAGPESATVPDVTGSTEREARATLQNAGLEVGDVEAISGSKLEKGLVVKTDPAAERQVPKGTEVTLYVSNGMVRVPDVRGRSQGDAQDTLVELGLKYKVTFVSTNSVPEGRVVEQEAVGQDVELGTVINLTVAQAAAPTTSPTPTESPSPTPTQSATPTPTTTSPSPSPTTSQKP